MTAIDIEVLVPLAQKGDRAAWAALLDSFRKMLGGLAKELIGSRYPHRSSSELAQDVFVNVIDMPKLFKECVTPEDTYKLLYCYLRTALKNRVKNVIRAEEADKRRPPGSSVPANGDSTAEPPPDPVRHTPVELELDLAAALHRLDLRDRELIVGYHYDRLTYRELADRLGIHCDVVHKQLPKARERLGALLQEWK